jgi:hypothetical protein
MMHPHLAIPLPSALHHYLEGLARTSNSTDHMYLQTVSGSLTCMEDSVQAVLSPHLGIRDKKAPSSVRALGA